MEHPWRDEERLRSMYWNDGMSLFEISEDLDCHMSTVHYWMQKHEIETRKVSHEKPPLFRTRRDGYEVWIHDTNGTQHQVRVHRLVCVADYGIDAVEEYDHVHHKNGVPWDNRPENLELLYAEDHHDLHAEDQRVEPSFTDSDLREWVYEQFLTQSQIISKSSKSYTVCCRYIESSPVWINYRPWRDEQVLRYMIDTMSVSEIASKFPVVESTIKKYLSEYDIDGWKKTKYDEQELRRLFFDEDMSVCEIADHYNVTSSAISQQFSKYDIETDYKTSEPDNTPWRDEDWLHEQFVTLDKSMNQISREVDSSRSVISKWLGKFDIK